MGTTSSKMAHKLVHASKAKDSRLKSKTITKAKKGTGNDKRERIYRLPASEISDLKICDSFDSAYWAWMHSDEAVAEYYGDAADVDLCSLPASDWPPPSLDWPLLQGPLSYVPLADSDEKSLSFGLAELTQSYHADAGDVEDEMARAMSTARCHSHDADADDNDDAVLVDRDVDIYADAEREGEVIGYFVREDAAPAPAKETCTEVVVHQGDEPWVVDPGLDAQAAQDWMNGGWDGQVSGAWLAAGGCEMPWAWVTRSWNEY